MTGPPPRAIRVAALAEALDALVAAAFGLPGADAAMPPGGVALHDLARDHALLFAPLLRSPLDPDALALAAGLGPAVGWSRFREPRPIGPEEAAAWRRLEAAYAPVVADLDARLATTA